MSEFIGPIMWVIAIAWLLMGGVALGKLIPELDKDTVGVGFMFCLVLAPFALGAVFMFHPKADEAKSRPPKAAKP